MSSTENRIVKMVFDNAQFKKAAAETKQSLTEVNQAVDSTDGKKGLLNLSSGMTRVMASASKMQTVVTTAVATITNKVVNAGLNLAKSLTIDPLKQGFTEYEQLLNKQNTIMNATGKSAAAVKKVLNDLNHYSDKTIFSFSDMTEGMTSFVNAGVPLKQAAQAMKGISNASALAGASTMEAQSSFRAFGQALGQGFLGLQDFRQAAVTGKIGTVGFKQSLIDAAVSLGTLTKRGKEYVTANGKTLTATKGFDLSLQYQWASAKVLNKALGAYADNTTKLGKKSFKAAQDVRSFTAFMDTLKESVGSGFSAIFTTLIGGLEESTSLWTGLSNTVGNSVQTFFKFANQTIKTWKSLGGLKDTVQGFKNILSPFVALFHAVGDAWAQAFPGGGKGAGGVLAALSHGFLLLTTPLAWLAKQIPKITPALATFFKIVKMGAGGISYVAGLISDLVHNLMGMVNIKAPSSGGFIKFFESIGNGAKGLVKAGVNAAQQFIAGLIDGFRNGSFDTAATIVSGGLIGALVLAIRKLMKNGLSLDLTGGVFDSIKEVGESVTGTFKAMQQQLQAKTLLEIAGAIGLITASVVALSLVNPSKLTKALTAIAVGFAQLLGSMAILVKISGSAGFVKVPMIAASMILLSGALLILVAAIAAMGQLKWETIGKGLAGIAGAIGVIGLALQSLKGPILLRTSVGLAAVAGSLVLISGVMKIFATMSWEEMAKGLVGLAGAMAILVVALNAMKGGVLGAAAILVIAPALTILAGALKIMASMSWEEIAKGLVVLGGALLELGLALGGIGASGLPGAAALLIITPALLALGGTMKLLGSLSWSAVAKGLVALGGSLLILAVGLTAMIVALPGAAALTVASYGLLALAGTLTILGKLSWADIAKGLTTLAAALAILSVAGVALLLAGPGLLMLGAAIGLIGVGVLAAGAGVAAFAAALGTLVVVGGGAISLFTKYLTTFLGLLPEIGQGVAEMVVSFVKTITANAPVFIKAFVTMVGGMLDAANKLLPKFARLVDNAIKAAIRIARANVNGMVDLGLGLIIALLNGINKNIGKIAKLGVDIIVNLINAISSQQQRLLNAGANAIIDFINKLADTIRQKSPELGKAMGNLGSAMVEGLITGIGSMAGEAISRIGSLASGLVSKAKGILKIFSPSRVFRDIGKFLVMGLTDGIQKNAASAITAVASMVSGQIAVANEYVDKFIQNLDQKAIAAQAKAAGLALAAQKAQKEAKKTKSKDDDKAANKLANKAHKQQKEADAAEKKAEAAKARQDRAEEFANASTIEKAKMRSEDAQNQLAAAKAAEGRAEKDRIAAAALEKQSHAKGVSDAERKKLQDEADKLKKQAKEEAERANKLLAQSKISAGQALALQKKAGQEAADAFQQQFDAEQKAADEQAKFDAMTDEEKAAKRRQDAADLQAKSVEDLEAAKKLAFTDLDAANDLAKQALEEADQARQYLTDAENYANQAAQGTGASAGNGQVVDVGPTDAAAQAFNNYSNLYDMATAAAAGKGDVVFNQYNTSPEALSDIEIYRNTNNQIAFAAEKLQPAA
jgi:hypothetical protein